MTVPLMRVNTKNIFHRYNFVTEGNHESNNDKQNLS